MIISPSSRFLSAALVAATLGLAARAGAGAQPDPACTFHEVSIGALTSAKDGADIAVDAIANGDGMSAALALRAAAEVLADERRHVVVDGKALLEPTEWKLYRKAVSLLRRTSLRAARRAVRSPAKAASLAIDVQGWLEAEIAGQNAAATQLRCPGFEP
jgi:hypothetical protein